MLIQSNEAVNYGNKAVTELTDGNNATGNGQSLLLMAFLAANGNGIDIGQWDKHNRENERKEAGECLNTYVRHLLGVRVNKDDTPVEENFESPALFEAAKENFKMLKAMVPTLKIQIRTVIPIALLLIHEAESSGLPLQEVVSLGKRKQKKLLELRVANFIQDGEEHEEGARVNMDAVSVAKMKKVARNGLIKFGLREKSTRKTGATGNSVDKLALNVAMETLAGALVKQLAIDPKWDELDRETRTCLRTITDYVQLAMSERQQKAA